MEGMTGGICKLVSSLYEVYLLKLALSIAFFIRAGLERLLVSPLLPDLPPIPKRRKRCERGAAALARISFFFSMGRLRHTGKTGKRGKRPSPVTPNIFRINPFKYAGHEKELGLPYA
jgi:hypothetical protein